MTRPRVYLCGAVDKLPDLGVGWRREVAAELEAAGCVAVWPTEELAQVGFGVVGVKDVKAYWSADLERYQKREDRHPISEAFERLEACDAVFVRWCADVGPGTRAEIAYAVTIGLPVVVWLTGAATQASVTYQALDYGPGNIYERGKRLSRVIAQCKRSGESRVAERERLRQEAGA